MMKRRALCDKVTAFRVAVAAVICITAPVPAFAARTIAITAYDDATREVSLTFGGKLRVDRKDSMDQSASA